MLGYVAAGLALIALGIVAYAFTKRNRPGQQTQPRSSCESCLMPFTKDTGIRENARYCSKCFRDGTLNGDGLTLRDFQAVCYAEMRKEGINPVLARFFTFMIRFAPRWRKKS